VGVIPENLINALVTSWIERYVTLQGDEYYRGKIEGAGAVLLEVAALSKLYSDIDRARSDGVPFKFSLSAYRGGLDG
jgi:hypothetical protein